MSAQSILSRCNTVQRNAQLGHTAKGQTEPSQQFRRSFFEWNMFLQQIVTRFSTYRVCHGGLFRVQSLNEVGLQWEMAYKRFRFVRCFLAFVRFSVLSAHLSTSLSQSLCLSSNGRHQRATTHRLILRYIRLFAGRIFRVVELRRDKERYRQHDQWFCQILLQG